MKKGQAALEFLTTYGWAFIAVLTAIAALSYFGVLKPNIPNRCAISPEFICQDYRISVVSPNNYGKGYVILSNGQDFYMNLTNATCMFPDGMATPDIQIGAAGPGWNLFDKPIGGAINYQNWEPGEKRRFECRLPDGVKGGLITGDKAKVRFRLTYTNVDIQGFPHTIDGEIIAEAVTE